MAIAVRGDGSSVQTGFGVLLRRHRTAAGLTQVRLAERSGYYVNYLRKLERGERRPSHHVMAALAAALHLSHADSALFERVALGGGVPEPPTVGREAELAVVENHLDAPSSDLLLMSGEPGIGKTRLLSEVKRLAGERGMLVLEVTCRAEGEVPLAPLREALEQPLWAMRPHERIQCLAGCEYLSRLIAESIGVTFQLRPVRSPEEEQQLVFEAMCRFLERLAGGRPIVLVLDDMHWADDETLDLIGQLLWLSGLPLHVIGTARDVIPDASPLLNTVLDGLVERGMVRRLALQPLTILQTGILCDELLGEVVDDGRRESLIRRSGGIPGFLVGMARGPLDGPVPEEIAEEILARVASLPEAAWEPISIAAVASTNISRQLIELVSGQTAEEVADGLELACAARVLSEGEDGSFACRCEIIAEAVTAAMRPARRTILTRRIADGTRSLAAVSRHGASPAVVVSSVAVTPATGWCAGS